MYDLPFLSLFYEDDKPINQHFQIQNRFLFSILSLLFGNYLRNNLSNKEFKFLNNIICFITWPNLSLHTYIVRVYHVSLEEIKFTCLFNWIFNLLVLWSFICHGMSNIAWSYKDIDILTGFGFYLLCFYNICNYS